MPSVPEVVRASPNVIVLPDSGPLITLAYAGALDVLMKPLWPIKIVDRVLDEVTRNATPTSELIRLWVQEQNIWRSSVLCGKVVMPGSYSRRG